MSYFTWFMIIAFALYFSIFSKVLWLNLSYAPYNISFIFLSWDFTWKKVFMIQNDIITTCLYTFATGFRMYVQKWWHFLRMVLGLFVSCLPLVPCQMWRFANLQLVVERQLMRFPSYSLFTIYLISSNYFIWSSLFIESF